MTSNQVLIIILRIIGTSSLFAVIFVVAPYAWMDTIHGWIGMGKLPKQPIVGYLARSTSAFYALLGGLLWVVSLDLPRYRGVLIYLGVGIVLFGAAIFVVDWTEGMPLLWKIWEGVFLMALGLVMTVLSTRIEGHGKVEI